MPKKKAKNFPIHPPQIPPDPWYKKIWVVLSILGFVFFTLIVNAPALFANLENLPSDTNRVKKRFLGWYYDDEAWTGLWSGFPEGYVNLAEMELSDVDLTIDLISENGEINGIIASKKMCEATPFSPFLLIDGGVNGNTATISIYDYIGGRRTDFVTAKLSRDGAVMTVHPVGGLVEWLPDKARLGLDPDPNDEKTKNIFSSFCHEELTDAIKRLRKNKPYSDSKRRRPIEEYIN